MSRNLKKDFPTEYSAWHSARRRVTDPSVHNWKHYGGRGIKMCEEWINNFAAFLNHIGPKPSPDLTLDRKDRNKGYEPGNVRWATYAEQNRNYSRNRLLTFNDKTLCVKDWEILMGFEEGLITNRLRRGWEGERLLSPARPHKPYEWVGKYKQQATTTTK